MKARIETLRGEEFKVLSQVYVNMCTEANGSKREQTCSSTFEGDKQRQAENRCSIPTTMTKRT